MLGNGRDKLMKIWRKILRNDREQEELAQKTENFALKFVIKTKIKYHHNCKLSGLAARTSPTLKITPSA